MTTAIVKKEITPDVWKMIEHIAPTMKDSRLFGVATAPQAAAIMLKGYELGLSMTASFEHIHVISDRPTLSPRGALALVLNSPEYVDMKISDETDKSGNPTACTVWMKRRNGLEYTAKFSMEDAKRAALIKPGSGWEKYPANMLRYRALGYAIDIVFPDVTGGMKRSDEFGSDITPDGEVIQGSWKIQEQPQSPQQPKITIEHLMKLYPPERILAVNDGNIPSTPAEIKETLAKLEKEDEEIDAVDVEASEEIES